MCFSPAIFSANTGVVKKIVVLLPNIKYEISGIFPYEKSRFIGSEVEIHLNESLETNSAYKKSESLAEEARPSQRGMNRSKKPLPLSRAKGLKI
jgi:hypothetical protein